ncbi:MAG TPA: DUF3800 domain-containing protein [Gammaproteobacteria bacterium]|nr:DUF3800 domain-containing protein [Gammaproteobacteria bacterium]
MSHWRFYVDDSGTKEYAASPELYAQNGNTRYFVFGGALVQADVAAKLGENLANLKKDHFGDANVEIKSNWLRIPKERKARYLDKHELTDEEVTAFVEQYYDLLAGSDVLLMAAVIDKQHMQEKYKTEAWYAPAMAYEILMQRLVQEVKGPDTVSVIIDDMDGATPKGNQYKLNLIKQHKLLRQIGSKLLKGLDWRPLQGLRFVDSAKSHHLQVADIISYNVYRQFVEHGDEWEDAAKEKLETYPWLSKLAHKFRNHEGRIQGYGIIKMPLRQRVQWHVGKPK